MKNGFDASPGKSGLLEDPAERSHVTWRRWILLSLLFFATTINYLDRAILGVILPEVRDRFHFGLQAYGAIQMSFQLAYAAGSLLAGQLLDRYGTRIGYTVAVAFWSAAAISNALARSVFQFGVYRTALGFGEAANFPACSKVAAESFPVHQRASVMGIVNAAPNVANIVGPPVVILVALSWGWQTCFVAIGGLGFLWLPLWLLLNKETSVKNPVMQPGISLAQMFRHRKAWAYALAKFLTDPVWWFYLFWLPTYLSDVRHLTPTERGTALMIVYAIAAAGAAIGGWVADFLIKNRGWDVGHARKTTMLWCAIGMPLFSLGALASDTRFTIVLLGLATAAHQAWMTNLFTAPCDVFPARAVGAANGFGACLGALGGALFSAWIPGNIIPYIGYVPVLLSMSGFYIVAWIILRQMMGDWHMLKLSM